MANTFGWVSSLLWEIGVHFRDHINLNYSKWTNFDLKTNYKCNSQYIVMFTEMDV